MFRTRIEVKSKHVLSSDGSDGRNGGSSTRLNSNEIHYVSIAEEGLEGTRRVTRKRRNLANNRAGPRGRRNRRVVTLDQSRLFDEAGVDIENTKNRGTRGSNDWNTESSRDIENGNMRSH